MTVYFVRVLERDLDANVAAGWKDTGVRTWIPSLFERQALLEFDGDAVPSVERTL